MRSSAGVGMTPPKVDGAPKPTSSVRISTIFGAPFGGTTRDGQPGFDWAALRLISPSNFCGGGGMYRPSIVVVASGEPGTPVVCWAPAGMQARTRSGAVKNANVIPRIRYLRYVTQSGAGARACAGPTSPGKAERNSPAAPA